MMNSNAEQAWPRCIYPGMLVHFDCVWQTRQPAASFSRWHVTKQPNNTHFLAVCTFMDVLIHQTILKTAFTLIFQGFRCHSWMRLQTKSLGGAGDHGSWSQAECHSASWRDLRAWYLLLAQHHHQCQYNLVRALLEKIAPCVTGVSKLLSHNAHSSYIHSIYTLAPAPTYSS